MADCIFCKIVAGDIGAQKVYEDEHAFAFLDIHPLAEGHTMVIPKIHAQHLADASVAQAAGVFVAVQKVSRAIRDGLGAPALTIGINDGSAAGQVVPHLHVHLIPRRPGDGGGNVHSIIEAPSERPLDEVQKLIADAAGR